MPLRYPPRREPRVLALSRAADGLHYATADPWEVRAVGSIPCRDLALAALVARLIRREKPTLVVARERELRGPVERVCRRLGVASSGGRAPVLPPPIARDLYPELPMRAPTPSFERIATTAIAAVLYAKTRPRHYAPRRQRSAEHATRATKAG